MPFVIGGAILAGGLATKSALDNKKSGGKAIPGQLGKGKGKKKKARTGSFTSPGFSGSFTGRGKNRVFNLERSAEQQGLLTSLQDRLGNTTSALRSLREQVRPGFGDLTQQRVQAIRDAGSRTVGNLREELGRRRVLGSSFAQREITATEATFARQEELARAEAKVQEFALTNQLITEEFDASFQTLNSLIDQGNFEASLAANIQSGAQTLQQNRQLANQQISQANQGGIMELIGTAISAYAIFNT